MLLLSRLVARVEKSVCVCLSACPSNHHHHHGRVAGEGRRVVALPCPGSTAHLQSSPVGRVESFRSRSSGRAIILERNEFRSIDIWPAN